MIFAGKSYIKRREFLKKSGLNFEMIKTTNTTVLKFLHLKEMYTEQMIKPRYLYLFQEIKKEVKNNISKHYQNQLEDYRKYLLYFQYSSNLGNLTGDEFIIENVIELDINKAYYQAARNLKFIDDKFYKKYIDLPKDIRLKLIGSIATQKQYFIYENGKLKDIFTEKDDLLRLAWFSIVNEVDEVLFYISKKLENNFIFYWVDGIYFLNNINYLHLIKEVKDRFNFELSIEKIPYIKIERRNKNESLLIVQKENETKKFNTKNFFKWN